MGEMGLMLAMGALKGGVEGVVLGYLPIGIHLARLWQTNSSPPCRTSFDGVWHFDQSSLGMRMKSTHLCLVFFGRINYSTKMALMEEFIFIGVRRDFIAVLCI